MLLMLLAMLLLPTVILLVPVILMIAVIALRESLRHMCGAALEVDVHPASVLLGGVLQPEFPTYLRYPWLDLLDVVGRVVSPADDAAAS